MCGHMYVEVRVLGVGFLHHMGSRDGTSVVRLGSNRPPCPTLSPALRRSFYIATEKQCCSERVTEVQGHECRRWDRAWMPIWDRKGRQSQLYGVSSEMLWRRGYFGLQLGEVEPLYTPLQEVELGPGVPLNRGELLECILFLGTTITNCHPP